MPLYDFQCAECGQITERWAKIEDRTGTCGCGGETKRLITTQYFINPDIEFVTDNISGEPIRVTSRKHLRRLERQHDVQIKIGKGWY